VRVIGEETKAQKSEEGPSFKTVLSPLDFSVVAFKHKLIGCILSATFSGSYYLFASHRQNQRLLQRPITQVTIFFLQKFVYAI